ncbi:hypothetical protein X943_001802 [Babesia divergens]|uniref:Uncharacterized protein n=1 Tax=Babesia divergens TaxID=32595 RepID=A0AAD9GHD4_BABDI|nr:hypothetical protein X943_001802 [Babesia divergens]
MFLTTVNKLTLCLLHWLLFCCYIALLWLPEYFMDFFDPSKLFLCATLVLHVISTGLQSSFFYIIFDLNIPGGTKESPKYLLCHFVGCCLSGCILRGMISFGGDAASTIIDSDTQWSIVFKKIVMAFSVITLISSLLWSYMTFCVLGNPGKEYLVLSAGKVLCLMFAPKFRGVLLRCALGWVLTPLCGIVTSTFIFNMTVRESIRLMCMQYAVYIAVSLLMFVFMYSCVLKVPCMQQDEINSVSEDVEGTGVNDGIKQTIDRSNKVGIGLPMVTKVFREAQPWCLLQSKCCSEWETQDNEKITLLQQCASVYNVIQSGMGRPCNVDEYDGRNESPFLYTYKEVTKAKYNLLTLIASLVDMCERLSLCLNKHCKDPCECQTPGQACCDKCYRCSYMTMQEGMCTLFKGSACLNNKWTKSDCCKDRCVAKCAMKAIVTNICEKLSNCVKYANKLMEEIRRCPQLSDDLDDSSIDQTLELLWTFLTDFLVCLYCYQVVEDWIALFECVDEIQQRCQESIQKFKSCCRAPAAATCATTDTGGKCGCQCLLQLCLCCQMLHKIQCDVARKATEKSNCDDIRVPSSAHTRSLLLLASNFDAVSTSKLAFEKSAHSSCKAEGCSCCRYSSRLDCLLTKWQCDMKSSMSCGDSLLRETIELVSNVASYERDGYISYTPLYLSLLRTFLGVSRSSASFVSLLYHAKGLEADKDTGSESDCTKVEINDPPNFCCDCKDKCKVNDCCCFLKECSKCKKVAECTHEILCKLSGLCDRKKIAGLHKCLTDEKEKFDEKYKELEKVCKTTPCEQKSIEAICCKVKDFVSKLFTGKRCNKGDAQKCGCTNENCICKFPRSSADLAEYLFYSCNGNDEIGKTGCQCHTVVTTATTECNVSSGDTTTSCNCRCMGCVLKKFIDALHGPKGTSGNGSCSTEGKDSTCNCGKDGLCKMWSNLCASLCDLKEKLCSPSGLCKKMECLLDMVDDVYCLMSDIEISLECLQYEYLLYQSCLSEICRGINTRFETEARDICALKSYLDKNAATYAYALKSAESVVGSISSLSSRHQSDVFTLDTMVNGVTNNCNQLGERAQNLYAEHIKCREGLESERLTLVLGAQLNHKAVARTTKNPTEYVLESINGYMRSFDLIWFVMLVVFLTLSVHSSGDSWIYTASRNIGLLMTVKGVVMSYSYLGLLGTHNRYQGYLINFSMVYGLLLALVVSWICQWYTYNAFQREHTRTIWRWFRVLHPTLMHERNRYFQWFCGIWSLMRADMDYMLNMVFGESIGSFYYNPFGRRFDNSFRLNVTALGFTGICDWPWYEKHILSSILGASMDGNFTELLYYLAFKSTPLSSMTFLFKDKALITDGFPLDLVWTAWGKGIVITLKHCVIYSLLEKAYTRVISMLQSQFDDVEAQNASKVVLNSFSKEEKLDISNKAMDVLFGLTRHLSAKQADALSTLFEDYYQQQWTAKLGKFATDGNETYEDENPSFIMPKATRYGLSWVQGLVQAAKPWENSRLLICDMYYGSSKECKIMVSSTANSIKRYLTHVSDYHTGPSFSVFLEGCVSFIRQFASATPKHLKGDTCGKPEGSVAYSVYSIFKTAKKDLAQERFDLHLYFVGDWLRWLGLPATFSDVRKVVNYVSTGCQLDV